MGDAAATRARILEAAVTEFAEFGMAGARVDRLAARAGCNKQLIYEYFGNKEGLFDAALESTTANLALALAFDPTDLTGYALGLYDYMVEHPEAARLVRWHELQRPGIAGALPVMVETNRRLLEAITSAQAAGQIATHLSAEMLLVFVLSLVQTTDDERLVNGVEPFPTARKREALCTAVRRLATPEP